MKMKKMIAEEEEAGDRAAGLVMKRDILKLPVEDGAGRVRTVANVHLDMRMMKRMTAVMVVAEDHPAVMKMKKTKAAGAGLAMKKDILRQLNSAGNTGVAAVEGMVVETVAVAADQWVVIQVKEGVQVQFVAVHKAVHGVVAVPVPTVHPEVPDGDGLATRKVIPKRLKEAGETGNYLS
jgi:hypothetical protein